jgi:glycerol uptake facilitator-like aquaporin
MILLGNGDVTEFKQELRETNSGWIIMQPGWAFAVFIGVVVG